MDVLFIFFAIVPIFVIVSSIAMWGRTGRLDEDINNLRREVQELKNRAPAITPLPGTAVPPPRPVSPAPASGAKTSSTPPQNAVAPQNSIPPAAAIPPASPVPPPSPMPPPSLPVSSVPLSSSRAADEIWEDELPRARTASRTPIPTAVASPPADAAREEEPRQGFEFNFGQKLPVWIGGIALALSGFYLVKYSIEKGLLTEEVRVLLGLVFGAILILAARHLRVNKPDMADGTRITQALSGAGIAVLYATIVAATSLYHMWPHLTGFAGMALVTALAVGLSIRHGMPIALLGMLGGFITPALIQSPEPHLSELLIYLYVLVLGLFAVIRVQKWWMMGLPTVILAFLWVIIWIFGGHFAPEDGVLLGLFILAVAGTTIALSDGGDISDRGAISSGSGWGEKTETTNWPEAVNYAVAVGAVVLMGFVTSVCHFAVEDWALYGFLGLGTLVMAWFRPRQYRFAPWLAMGGTLVMLAVWEHAPDATYALLLLGFALLFGLGGLVLLALRPALEPAGLLSASTLGFYGLGYLRLEEHLGELLNLEAQGAAVGEHAHIWGPLALILGAVFALLTTFSVRSFDKESPFFQQVLALFALTTTAFLSLALGIEVRHEFLGLAFAAETLAVCWINTLVDIKALRNIAGVLLGIFIALMGEQLLMLGAVVVNSLFGFAPDLWHGALPLATDPMFQLGLPMMLLGLAAWFVLRHHDGQLTESLEITAVGLGALLLYYGTRNFLHVPHDVLFRKPSFPERGLITNLFYAAGLAVVYGGRLYSRRAIVWSGTALFGMALFRTVWFDFITANPLISGQEVGAAFLFNGLLLAYLMPAFWLWLEEKPPLRLVTTSPSLRGGVSFILLFTYVSLNVRQGFHGPVLSTGATSDEEIYAYSAVWLMLGGLLLFLGTLRKDKTLRSASLVVMLLTICKVFLYDAANLAGLYRVFSFLGLGLSLIGLSWFYSRFVFVQKKK